MRRGACEVVFKINISIPADLREPVTAVLYDHGCTGIEEQDDVLVAYFPETVSPDEIKCALSGFDGLTVSCSPVKEKDWQAAWKERFDCVRAAGFFICPPWKIPNLPPSLVGEDGAERRERVVLIDPGNAFGAGDHVTTLTVLKFLRQWADGQNNLAEKSLLDIGTGTGILAVAAHMMGVGSVTAVDTDESSVEAAEKNFALNGITSGARIIHGSIRDAGESYDIILANLFLEPLLELMRPIADALSPGGALIISGLLSGQEKPVLTKAARQGLMVEDGRVVNGWFSGMLRRAPACVPGRNSAPERGL